MTTPAGSAPSSGGILHIQCWAQRGHHQSQATGPLDRQPARLPSPAAISYRFDVRYHGGVSATIGVTSTTLTATTPANVAGPENVVVRRQPAARVPLTATPTGCPDRDRDQPCQRPARRRPGVTITGQNFLVRRRHDRRPRRRFGTASATTITATTRARMLPGWRTSWLRRRADRGTGHNLYNYTQLPRQ